MLGLFSSHGSRQRQDGIGPENPETSHNYAVHTEIENHDTFADTPPVQPTALHAAPPSENGVSPVFETQGKVWVAPGSITGILIPLLLHIIKIGVYDRSRRCVSLFQKVRYRYDDSCSFWKRWMPYLSRALIGSTLTP